MLDITQTSTHLANGKKGRDERLDDLLIQWGLFRAEVLPGLNTGNQTPIAVAMKLHKKHKKNNELTQPKQTRTYKPIIPPYWVHRRMAKVNRAVWDLEVRYQEILIRHYEDGWKGRDFVREFGWELSTYKTYISRARREIKKHPLIRELLGRS